MRAAICIGLLALLTGLAGCADDEPTGGPPTVSNLTATPTTLNAGELTTISGQMSFTDGDGDVAQMDVELAAGGQIVPFDPIEVKGAAGLTEGNVPFQLQIQINVSGPATLTLWLIDGQGHLSNKLSTNLTVN